ncbi:MAG: outer-membrane lipoprotein carrier protein LolA [Bdellovibrionaceae bacterium]|nr:outer-membrane lipoprotein carrier protein LolA [Pseudobdellovibrionaceae bacterium]
MIHIKLSIVMTLFALLSFANLDTALAEVAKKPESATNFLKSVSKKYRGSKMIKIATEKKVTSELMGKTTVYAGHVYLARGKFRWENDSPDESLLLFDGENIWNVQYPPKDLGGSIQVAKAKLSKNTQSQILISMLIGREPIDKNFEITSETRSEQGVLDVELKPRSQDVRVKQLHLGIDIASKEIRKISYKDDVDNSTVIEMKKTEFLKSEKRSLFKYKVPKDAQVTNL